MKAPMTARPTVYKGIQMRSRLEAAYAQQLDEYPFPWEYEPQCFADETGQYLPDFRLPGRGDGFGDMYVEIKPASILTDRAATETALRRMEIIWSTDPDASLVLRVGQGYPPTFETYFSAWGASDRLWHSGTRA